MLLKMNISKLLPFAVALVLLISMISFGMQSKGSSKKIEETAPPSTVSQDQHFVDTFAKIGTDIEMRGVWVSYFTLDMSGTDRSEKAFRQKFDEIVKTAKQAGFNTLIVQVRPFSDALYQSKYFPTSHVITGEQGAQLKYDPLKYMCEKSHEMGLAIHAWVNPYRVASKHDTKLSKNNPYYINNALGVVWKDEVYYNPALKEVRALIINGVKEIAENYDVDGIQFDDYFYPTQDKEFDKAEYDFYKKSVENQNNILSLDEWRKANVNILIAETYRAVHGTKKNVVFGISPQGNLKNNNKLYADVAAWCRAVGYIDYICPQIYFSLDNPSLTFEESLAEWIDLQKHKQLKIYVGLAGYKAGTEEDSGTWLDNDDILMQEIQIIREKDILGFMLYSYEALLDETNKAEIENVIALINAE